MGDKIYTGFLIVVITALLFLLPVSDAVIDFSADADVSAQSVATASVTTAEITLPSAIYNNNHRLVTVTSSNASDTPAVTAYNTTTQNITLTGLVENTTRTLTADYYVFALEGGTAIEKFTGYIPLFWILVCIAFPVVALAAMAKAWFWV